MRNLLALLAAAVLTFAGIGWYLGWYQIKSTDAALSGHQNVNIDINGAKILSDVEKTRKVVEEMKKNASQAANNSENTNSTPAEPVSPAVPSAVAPRP
jgi:hypothetical protein